MDVDDEEKLRIVTVVSRKKHPELFELLAAEGKYYRSRKLASLAASVISGDGMPPVVEQDERKIQPKRKAGPKAARKQEGGETVGDAKQVSSPVLKEQPEEFPAQQIDDEELARRKELVAGVARSFSF